MSVFDVKLLIYIIIVPYRVLYKISGLLRSKDMKVIENYLYTWIIQGVYRF